MLLFRWKSINNKSKHTISMATNSKHIRFVCIHCEKKIECHGSECDSLQGHQVFYTYTILLYEFYHQNKFAFNCIAILIWDVCSSHSIIPLKKTNCVEIVCERVNWIELNWIEATEFHINSLYRTKAYISMIYRCINGRICERKTLKFALALAHAVTAYSKFLEPFD